MIVSCPACSARYKISESKMRGRGAKITCPRCGHRFVVYRDATPSRAPEHVSTLDFSAVGVTWRVRRSGRTAYQLYDLKALRDLLDQGLVDRRDDLSFDGRAWTRIADISSLEIHFWDAFQRARRGEVSQASSIEEEPELFGGRDDEEEADAPTMIVAPGSPRNPRSLPPGQFRSEGRSGPGNDAVLLFDDETPSTAGAHTFRRHGEARGASDLEPESVSDDATVMRPGPPTVGRTHQTVRLLAAVTGEGGIDRHALPPPPLRAAKAAAPRRPNVLPLVGLGFAGVFGLAVLCLVALYASGVFGGLAGPSEPEPADVEGVEPAHDGAGDGDPNVAPEPTQGVSSGGPTPGVSSGGPTPGVEPAPEPVPEPTPRTEPRPRRPAPADPVPAPDPVPDAAPVPVPSVDVPSDPVPQPVPAEPVPAEPVPAEPVPAEPVPAEPVPAEPVPAEPVPAEPVPAEPVPAEPAPAPVPAEPAPAPAPATPEPAPAPAPTGEPSP